MDLARDSSPPQHEPAAAADLLAQVWEASPRDAQAASLQAALLESARLLQGLRERVPMADEALRERLARCEALQARAVVAAREGSLLAAFDCLQQIERERVPLLNDDERSAEMALLLAESRARLVAWRQEASEALALQARGEAPPVAALQGLLRNVHAARQEQLYRVVLLRQQLPTLVLMLGTAVLFFAVWALLGGFDWLARDDVEITVGMLLVSGVLMGYFGALVSFTFDWLRADLAARLPDLRTQRWLAFARPAIGASVAVPIVLFVEAGLINLGQLSPAIVLAMCFIGGFSERWFAARIERMGSGHG